MRRFPLRLKIAGFAAGLILLATALVALFTVILPWRAKLKAQERLASQLVKTALPLGIDLRADGAYFDPARVHALVANSSRVQGVEIVYALIWDDKGNLDSAASSVNTMLLQKASEPLAQLYLRDPARALQVLAIGRRQPGIRRLPIKLAAEGGHSIIGRLDLGLSTMAIDSELRRSLIRDAFVLVGTLFFAVLSALSIARRIAQPLTDLSAAMGRVREGDFEITAAPSARTNDEIGDLARSFDEMAQGLKERERLRGTLGRYVSGDVAERILSEDDDLSLRGEVRHVAVLFLDVRGTCGPGHVGALPLLRDGMPLGDLDVDGPVVALRDLACEVPDALGLLPAAGVAEQHRAVPGDDHALVEGVLKIVLELVGIELLGEVVGHTLLVEVDAHPPVVVHGPTQ